MGAKLHGIEISFESDDPKGVWVDIFREFRERLTQLEEEGRITNVHSATVSVPLPIKDSGADEFIKRIMLIHNPQE